MSKIDDYLERYLIEHGDYKETLKLKRRRFIIASIIIILLFIAVNPLVRIREAYVYKFKNYAANNKDINLFEGTLLDVNTSKKENIEENKKESKTYTSKYPKPIEGVVTNNYSNSHTGIDIQGEHRSNIIAIEDGTVTFAGIQSGYGNCVEIKHKDENGNVFYSFYAHLYQIIVKQNDKVKMFDVIGKEGGDPKNDPNPGNSTGHHLHFEIRTAPGYGSQVNPTKYIF